jgi:CubicO group peptidase (beta-lactamase class C family)
MRSIRLSRALALASAAAVLAPASAAAMPMRDRVDAPAPTAPATTTIVREVPADDGGQTLALILSGTALVVAAGAAARTVRLRPATAGPAART